MCVAGTETAEVRSFTPPPNSILSELHSHSLEQTESQPQSSLEGTEASTPDVMMSAAREEGEKMEEENGEGEGEGKGEGEGEGEGKSEGQVPLKTDTCSADDTVSVVSSQTDLPLEETADLSMTEAPDQPAFSGDFDRHLSVVREGWKEEEIDCTL